MPGALETRRVHVHISVKHVPEDWTKHPACAMERNIWLREPDKAPECTGHGCILNNNLEDVQTRKAQFLLKKKHVHELIYY